MTQVLTNNFGIENILKELGLKENNYGASTGLKHIATKGKKIDSYSPVDGKLIGSINAATAEDYSNVMKDS
jgi:aldehyde dehydrogenase (NAD+)